MQKSRAGQLGRDRFGKQGAAKAQKQGERSNKQTCSQPRAKEKRIFEAPSGMVEVDPN